MNPYCIQNFRGLHFCHPIAKMPMENTHGIHIYNKIVKPLFSLRPIPHPPGPIFSNYTKLRCKWASSKNNFRLLKEVTAHDVIAFNVMIRMVYSFPSFMVLRAHFKKYGLWWLHLHLSAWNVTLKQGHLQPNAFFAEIRQLYRMQSSCAVQTPDPMNFQTLCQPYHLCIYYS